MPMSISRPRRNVDGVQVELAAVAIRTQRLAIGQERREEERYDESSCHPEANRAFGYGRKRACRIGVFGSQA